MAIDLAHQNKHHELAKMIEKMMGIANDSGDDEKEDDVDELSVGILQLLGLKTKNNEWIRKWIPIVKRNASNWKIGQENYGMDLIEKLEGIEHEFRNVDVNDGEMNHLLMECVDKYRTQILQIFDVMEGLYRSEIDLCKSNREYLQFLNHFMTRSKEFGKFEAIGETYDREHGYAIEDHKRSMLSAFLLSHLFNKQLISTYPATLCRFVLLLLRDMSNPFFRVY